jgi:hypothetical protein
MKTVALIIVLQFIVSLLSGCAEFETKMDEMRNQQLTCSPADSNMCAGWKVEEF